MSHRICPKCESEMLAGVLLEKGTSGDIDLTPTDWVQFDPSYYVKHGFFKGKHVVERRSVTSFRCKACGFLESFAGDVVS